MTNDQTVTQAAHDCVAEAIAQEIADHSSHGKKTDNYARIYQAAYLGAAKARKDLAAAHSGEGRSNGAGEDRSFQVRVHEWMLECFGPEIEADRQERADRFIEEALELAQTMPGFNADRAHALVDYVFGRTVGERHQEVGGVMVTLAALCNTVGLRIDEEAERELARVWTKVEAIRAKQDAKPTGSALPVALSAPQGKVERLTRALRDAADTFDKLAASMREEEADLLAVEIAVAEQSRDQCLAALAQPEAGGER